MLWEKKIMLERETQIRTTDTITVTLPHHHRRSPTPQEALDPQHGQPEIKGNTIYVTL
jgi:hypothetical protein